jgi:hypothetical protein
LGLVGGIEGQRAPLIGSLPGPPGLAVSNCNPSTLRRSSHFSAPLPLITQEATTSSGLTASSIFWFTPIATGALFLANVWLVAAVMWLLVGAVAVGGGWRRPG